jgi:hypothetical protein
MSSPFCRHPPILASQDHLALKGFLCIAASLPHPIIFNVNVNVKIVLNQRVRVYYWRNTWLIDTAIYDSLL